MKDSAQPGALSAPVSHHAHPPTSGLSFTFPIWARYILGAFVVGFVSYALFFFLRQRAVEGASEIWYRLDTLNTSESLKEFADRSDSGLAGQIARFKLAREELRNGLRDFASRKLVETKTKEGTPKTEPALASLDSLNRAAKSYGELSKVSNLPKVLEIEANLGAAKAHEALGSFTEAESYYKKAASLAPESDMGLQAKAGIERLSKTGPEIKDLQDKLLNAAKGTRP